MSDRFCLQMYVCLLCVHTSYLFRIMNCANLLKVNFCLIGSRIRQKEQMMIHVMAKNKMHLLRCCILVHTVEHSYNKLLYNQFLDITKQ